MSASTATSPKRVIRRSPKYTYDPLETETLVDQLETEETVGKYYNNYMMAPDHHFHNMKLQRDFHIYFLLNGLKGLSSGFESLDASKPWLIYWIVHGLDLLGALDRVPRETMDGIVDYLGNRCQNRVTGGFGGGPYQLSHTAPTYASVNALCIVNGYTSVENSALDVIDREKLYQFFMSLKDEESGGFRVHKDGELDVRGCYTVLSVASMLNICTEELKKGVDRYVVNSQTYEGGVGSFPGHEAHGGYAFCGLASLVLLKNWSGLNLEEMIYWCARRQMSFEGGFQGRTNKLVDSCYSFWMGGTFPLIQGILAAEKSENERTESDVNIFAYLQWAPPTLPHHHQTDSTAPVIPASASESGGVQFEEERELDPSVKTSLELADNEWLFNQTALEEYLMLCSQMSNGGMRDKPGKSRDFYHTCYALSGLSIAHNNPSGKPAVLGDQANRLRQINPIVGICTDRVTPVIQYFGNRQLL